MGFLERSEMAKLVQCNTELLKYLLWLYEASGPMLEQEHGRGCPYIRSSQRMFNFRARLENYTHNYDEGRIQSDLLLSGKSSLRLLIWRSVW